MKLTTIILDDEYSACQVLASMINDYCPELNIILVSQNPHEVLDVMYSNPPDILFIDIHMPKMSGFDFLEKVSDFKGKIIFTTAFNQYAIKAFKFSAFDYLLKPIHVDHLEQTVARLISNLQKEDEKPSIPDLIQSLNKKTTIVVPHNGEKVFILIENILYLEAYGNYTIIHEEGQKYTLSKTLKEFEDNLDPTVFIRIHKSYIVNINNTKKFNSKNSAELIMKSGVAIPVSRRKRHLLNQFTIQ